MNKAISERNQARAELEKLAKQIEAEEAGLKTLKPGSTDHLKATKEMLEKKANLQAQQEYYQQQTDLKDQQWTEKLYTEILEITGKVAEDKGLQLVFEEDEPEFPSSNANELMLTIRTHKLLYHGGCTDITDDVIKQLDEQKESSE